MILSVIVLIILCTPGLRIKKERDSNYMNRLSTSSILGVFVICIFMSHVLGIMSSNNIFDIAATYFYQSAISQMMVVPFLFYSGYGIIKQYNEKGRKKYLLNFPIQRFFKTYLIYAVCEIFGHLVYSATTGFSVFGFSFSVLLIWDTLWFAFVILALYLIIFLCLCVFGNKRFLLCTFTFILAFCLVFVLYLFGKPQHWYNTMIAFPFGVFFGCYKDKIDEMLMKVKTRYLFCALAIIIASYCGVSLLLKYVTVVFNNIVLYLFAYYSRSILFISGIILFCFIFSFGNSSLTTISKYSLYSYIIQWFAFEVFKNVFPLLDFNIYLYFVVTLVSTALISFLIKICFDAIYKRTLAKIIFKG